MRRIILALATLLVLGAPLVVGVPPAQAAVGPCGSLSFAPAEPPHYSHVVVIMDENFSYANYRQTQQAPYLHGLAAACGSEAFMHAATHSSQPNYMAATSGVASGVATQSGVDNIFAQSQRASQTWKSYEESMPANCGSSSGLYQKGHNPALWYTDLRTPVNGCAKNDVPMEPALTNDIAGDSLPAYSWITANLCNSMHWDVTCPTSYDQRIAVGDHWLSSLIPRLTGLPSYRAGRTLIVVTWDEGNGPAINGVDCTNAIVYAAEASCQIPTFVLSPYLTPGAVDPSEQNLYSLLATTQDILGYPRLGNAITQRSMRGGLGF